MTHTRHTSVSQGAWEPLSQGGSDNEASRIATAQLAHALRACELLHRNPDLGRIFEGVVEGAVALGYRRVALNVRDAELGRLKPAAFAGLSPTEARRLHEAGCALGEMEPLFEERCRIGDSFFIREGAGNWGEVLGDRFVLASAQQVPSDETWHPEDWLIIPLLGAGGELLGVLLLNDPLDGLRPHEDVVRLLKAYAHQAAIAIVHAALLERLQEELLDSALAENALRESEGRYRTIFEASSDAIIVLDENGRITVANPATSHMSGYSADEVVGSPIDLFLNVQPSKARTLPPEGGHGGGPLEGRSVGIRRDGTPFDVELQSARISLDQKRQTLLVVKDISRRVLAERRAERANSRIRRLHDAALRLAACGSEEEVCQLTVDVGENVLAHEFCALYVERDGRLLLGACSDDQAPSGSALPLSHGSCVASAFHARKPVVAHETEPSLPGSCRSAHVSAFAVPVGDVAALYIASHETRAFAEEDIRAIELLAGHVGEAIRRVRLQERLRSQAMLDPLTGVYNRRYFNEVIQQELLRSGRYEHSVAFLMIDINRFKEVNDLLGHQIGDLVLRDVAALLRQSVRDVDWVVRYGGDEFLIVLPETPSRLQSVHERLAETMADWSTRTALVDFPLTLAVGWAEWDPRRPRSLQQVLSEADRMMYVNKASRRDGNDQAA